MEQETSTMTKPVLELMEQGLTIVRMENENMQAMAIQRPRDVKALTQAALEELRAFPQFAKKAYYSIPYKDRSDGQEKTVHVEGPSVKAANALARHWGNNSSGFRIVGADEERIMVQGVFIDHETGMRRTAEISVSRKAKTSKGVTYSLDVNRLNMAIQAGGSKAVRNAILNGLPVGLVDGYFEESKALAARGGVLTQASAPDMDAQAIRTEMEKCYQRFEGMSVPREDVREYVAHCSNLADEEQVVAHLVGLLNAIDDGTTNVAEVFAAIATGAPIAAPQRASAQRQIPDYFRKMDSKVANGSCAKKACTRKIALGEKIYFDTKAHVAYHEACA